MTLFDRETHEHRSLRRAISVHCNRCSILTSKGADMSDERVLNDIPVIGRIDLHEVERREPLPSERFAEADRRSRSRSTTFCSVPPSPTSIRTSSTSPRA